MIDLVQAENNQCLSVKSRNQREEQCPHPRKNHDFCGLHSRAKKTIRFQPVCLSIKQKRPSSQDLHSSNNEEEDLYSEPEEIKNQEYYQLDHLRSVKADQLNFDKLIKTCRFLKIQIAGDIEKIKNSLIKYYESEKFITEAYDDLTLCNNTCDFCAFEDLADIPTEYLFIFQCEDSLLYGLDLRSLNMYLLELDQEGKVMDRVTEYINPYNRQSLNNQTLNQFQTRLNELTKRNQPTKYQTVDQSPEEKVYFDTMQVFHHIYSQGFPVEANWFLNLSVTDLQNLYFVMEEVWNQRLNLTSCQKRRVVPSEENQPLFNKHEFDQLKEQWGSRKLEWQQVLIKKIDLLVTSAQERDDRNTGIFYFLLGLKEIVDIGDVVPI